MLCLLDFPELWENAEERYPGSLDKCVPATLKMDWTEKYKINLLKYNSFSGSGSRHSVSQNLELRIFGHWRWIELKNKKINLVNLISFILSKGQLISEVNFWAYKSPQRPTKFLVGSLFTIYRDNVPLFFWFDPF